MLDNLLQLHLSQALLERERTFKTIYSSTFERCREQIAQSHAYHTRFKLGHHLEIGQKVLYENHKQGFTRSQKLQQRRLGPFTVTKRVTNTTYEIQDDKDRTVNRTVHRNYLVEYYPKEGSLPAMIEKGVPPNHQNNNFYERFMEQSARDLNNPSTTEKHDSLPFPIEPLGSILSINKPKRYSMHSNDSEITSPFASSRTLCYHLHFLRKHRPPIHVLRSKHKLLNCRPGNTSVQSNNLCVTVPPAWPETALNCALKRLQPNYTDSQSVLRTITRQGYTL